MTDHKNKFNNKYPKDQKPDINQIHINLPHYNATLKTYHTYNEHYIVLAFNSS